MITETQHRIILTETAFLKKLGMLLGETISRQVFFNEATGKIEDKLDYFETELDEYLSNIFKPAVNICNIYEQLEFIPIFISKFPKPKFYENNGINHPKYLQYHVENHFMKISTIFDLLIILVNELYKLGIPPRLSSFQQLVENRHTKNTKLIKLIKKFDKAIQGIKTIRNLIAHRGEFNDTEIDKVHQYYFVSNPKTTENPIFSKDALESQMDFVTKQKLILVNKNNKAVLNIIKEIFEEAFIIFDVEITKYDSNRQIFSSNPES